MAVAKRPRREKPMKIETKEGQRDLKVRTSGETGSPEIPIPTQTGEEKKVQKPNH